MGMRIIVPLADEPLKQSRKPDCDVIFVLSIAYRRSCPGRSFTYAIKLSGLFNSFRINFTISRFAFSLLPPIL